MEFFAALHSVMFSIHSSLSRRSLDSIFNACIARLRLQWVSYTVHETYKSLFSVKFLLKMVHTALFIHLKIILLQCFQFSVISGIQITHYITSVFLFYTKRKVSGVRIEVEALQQYFKYSKMIACISTLLATKRKRKKQRKGLGGGGQCRA